MPNGRLRSSAVTRPNPKREGSGPRPEVPSPKDKASRQGQTRMANQTPGRASSKVKVQRSNWRRQDASQSSNIKVQEAKWRRRDSQRLTA